MAINAFLRLHIERLSEDYDVYVISNFSSEPLPEDPRATYIHLPLAREISLISDISALFKLFGILHKNKFDSIHSVTPKAGLLGMIAASFSGIHNRIHWFTGQVWVTKAGFSRKILKSADKLIAFFATKLLADSPSQRNFLVEEGICRFSDISVIGDGSICGVDGNRFKPDSEARMSIRNEHGISPHAQVVLFLGRLNVDKGLRELVDAMLILNESFQELHWLIVGPDEDNIVPMIDKACTPFIERVHFKGFTREPEAYMAAADIFCLPSYREGFGSSVLEAAAVGVPAVATKIYGLTDAVEDGVTGILVPPADSAALAEALKKLLTNNILTLEMGENARIRALELFSRERIVNGLSDYYKNMFHEKDRS
jgi:glycosyltransferase involved in cell wall biosynthesis